MKKRTFILLLTAIFINTIFGQVYKEQFENGIVFYNNEQYYEAYLRFNAAYVISDIEGDFKFAQKSRLYLDSAAYGIQRQQVITDSLLQATKKITDAFYFYDNKLALAYNGSRYGFINKNGEVVIYYKYEEATPFNENTGYAKVVRDKKTYWLSPDGTEYPYTDDISSLPKIEKDTSKVNQQEIVTKKNLTNIE